MIIGIVYNEKNGGFLSAEYDKPIVPQSIAEVLSDLGHKPTIIPMDSKLEDKIKLVEFVFNLAEGFPGPSRESYVPSILERMAIPYTGSDAFTLQLMLNKYFSKVVLSKRGVPVPEFDIIVTPDSIDCVRMKYPMIVKPVEGGSSIGITNNSVVNNYHELKDRSLEILTNYNQHVVVEELLNGEEYTVGIVGNKNPKVFPPVWVSFNHIPEGYHRIDSQEVKWDYDPPSRLVYPAPISGETKKAIEDVALKAWYALGLRDVCRMDIRLDSYNNPRLLEVNGLPGLNPTEEGNSRMVVAAKAAGMNYHGLVSSIFHAALDRYGLRGK